MGAGLPGGGPSPRILVAGIIFGDEVSTTEEARALVPAIAGQRLCNTAATETGMVVVEAPLSRGSASVTPRLFVPSQGGVLYWRWMRDSNELGSPIREQLSRGVSGQRRFNSQPVSTPGRYEVRLYNDNKPGDATYGNLIGRVEFSTN